MQARGQLRLTWRLYAESPQSGEISFLNSPGSREEGDLSTQSIMGAFSICLPYRHAAPLEMTMVASAHPRHFDRSEAEWRNLTPPMTEKLPTPSVISTKALRSGEISPSNGMGGITSGDLSAQSIMGAVPIYPPYRHAAPLEMTVLASAPLVISTEAKRSGEISHP